jgi:hypothetical protein
MKILKSITVTYDHRLERIGHPLRSAIHKLHNRLDISLNRANRHGVKFKPLAALKGEATGEQGEQVGAVGEQGSIIGRSNFLRQSRVKSGV